MTSEHEPSAIKLPGFGLPYDDWGQDPDLYAQSISAVMNWSHEVTTTRERCMLALIDSLSDKPDWTCKVRDEAIISKWRQEVKELDWRRVVEGGDFSDKMFAFCIEELRYKADLYEKTGVMPVFDASSCVLKSDVAIPSRLKEALREAVSPLENVPESRKDWHPGSNGTVLDLVHPSLFPLVYGRSRILPDSTITLDDSLTSIGKGVTAPCPVEQADDPGSGQSMIGDGHPASTSLWSHRFQWLPCNVSFPDGKNAQIDSYINNLHPQDHEDLYHVIEKIITKAIPFWNVVYQSVHNHGMLATSLRVRCDEVSYKYPEGYSKNAPEDSNEDDFWEYEQSRRVYNLPEPKAEPEHDITVSEVEREWDFLDLEHLGDTTNEKHLQVIVKLASIHLTPEKPDYKGSSWHIEGQLNEHIVATALYYYDSDNITESRLHFRTKVEAEYFDNDIRYEQSDGLGFKTIWGIDNGSEGNQVLGSVLTREDRLIAFPNGFQHRVGDFKLVDPTRPGHRKILALFLVAPTIPIISTANVPPQQRDWWAKQVKLDDSRVGQLPVELIDMIAEGVEDFPIGLDDAKKIREELMAERGRMSEAAELEMFKGQTFSFCEH